jgi:hypothetical protein
MQKLIHQTYFPVALLDDMGSKVFCLLLAFHQSFLYLLHQDFAFFFGDSFLFCQGLSALDGILDWSAARVVLFSAYRC